MGVPLPQGLEHPAEEGSTATTATAAARAGAALGEEVNQDILSQHALTVQSTLEGISPLEKV